METRLEVIERLIVRAERLGYASFGLAEGWGLESFSVLGHLAARTSTIGLSTGVASVWSRSPAVLAMGAMTMQQLSSGRFALGVGASTPTLVEGLHDLPWSEPLERLRRSVIQIRALLHGDRVPLSDGRREEPLRLGARPAGPVAIRMAGMATGSVRLAGELADGWVPWLWPRTRLHAGRELLLEGRERAAAPRRTAVLPAVPLAVADDEASARRMAAGWLHTYLTRMGTLYPRLLRRHGYGSAIDAVLADGGQDLPAEAADLVDDLMVWGTCERATAAVDAWLEAGIDGLTLVLPAGLPAGQLDDMLAACAPLARRASATSARSTA